MDEDGSMAGGGADDGSEEEDSFADENDKYCRKEK